MIKKYGQFVNENQEAVSTKSESELDDQMVCIPISQDEENLFGSESILQNLVNSGRITYKSGELCYPSDDEDVVDIIKSYFKGSIKESVNEVRHNDFDEGPDGDEEHTSKWSMALNDVEKSQFKPDVEQLARDAFEAGRKFAEGKVKNFDTWWSSYKK